MNQKPQKKYNSFFHITLISLILCICSNIFFTNLSNANDELKIIANQNTSNKTLEIIFPWEEQVAASIFLRDKILWIIFNKQKNINFKDLQKLLGKNLTLTEQIPNKENTIIRIKIDNLSSIKATKNGSAWKISCSNDNMLVPSNIIKQYNSPFAKGIFFPLENYSQPIIQLIDPIIGDELSVIPVYEADTGVNKKKSFVDFLILNSAQGFVAKILSDATYISLISPGIEFIVPEKNFIKNNKTGFVEQNNNSTIFTTPPIDKITTDSNTPHITAESILNIPKVNNYNYNKIKSILDYQLMLSRGLDQNNNIYKLASFYFANQQYKESAAAIRFAIQNKKSKKIINKYILMMAISEYMENHFETALNAINMISTSNNDNKYTPELDFWKNIINIQNDNPGENWFNTKSIPNFLNFYPPNILNKALITQLQFNIKNNMDDDLIEWLITYINQNNSNMFIQNDLLYYQGLQKQKTENIKDALEILKPLSEQNDDKRNKLRAGTLYYQILLSQGIISTEKTILELNKLRNTWRGGKSEINLLIYLGGLYNQTRDYKNVLNTLKAAYIVSNDAGDRLLIASQISDAFMKYFTDPESINNATNFDAVSLFYEYKDYMPIGKAGDQVVSEIIEKIINLDLLDKAILLLDHQINFRLAGKEKQQAILKLADVYLKNNTPKKAIEIINSNISDIITMPDGKKISNQIMAKSYLQLQQYDQAYHYIKNDFSNIGNFIKIDIFNQQSKFDNLQILLLVLLEDLKPEQTDLTLEQEKYLEMLVLCYYMQNDIDNIRKLYQKYNKVIDKNKLSMQLLTILSAENSLFDYNNLKDDSGINNFEKFLQQYKQSINLPDIKNNAQ